jgi:DNA polymerase III subunit chi
MTRIDFHTNISDKLLYACRLARKAYGARGASLMSMLLLAEDAAQAQALNAALWTFSDQDFLPHVMAGDALATRTPIIVTADELGGEASDFAHCTMLINLARREPAGLARFERVFEIISTDEADAAAGRKRYVSYKQQSYPLTHFVAGTS